MSIFAIRSIIACLLFPFALIAAEDRINGTPGQGAANAMRNTVPAKARSEFDRGPADPAMRIEYATLRMKPAEGLEGFLAEQQSPGSENYHKWLTPEDFADRFGLTGNDVAKAVTWLQSHGLEVKDIARGRLWISFSGTAGQMNRAFHTSIHSYLIDGEMRFANATDLSIPAELEGVVSAVHGLHNFKAPSLYRARKIAGEPLYNSASGKHAVGAGDLATIYNLNPLYANGIDGTGMKIAIIGTSDIDLADIRAYRNRFGLAPNDPQVVLYGPDPGTNSGGQGEADLDLEIAGAVAPKATLIYVNAQDFVSSSAYAVDQNLAPVMSVSYGFCEQEAVTAFGSLESVRAIAQQANAQGITWLTSSGDVGAATCDRTAVTAQATRGANVSFPSTFPEVTSVGGTQFAEAGGSYWASSNGNNLVSVLSYIPETAWNDAVVGVSGFLPGAGGGGLSEFFAKPAWQQGPGVPNDGARDVPDISFMASDAVDPFLVIFGGSLYSVGGTSVSSPLFAGMVALLNQSLVMSKTQAEPGLGNINPSLYRLAQTSTGIFHDITTGDNRIPCQQGSPGCVNGMVGYAAGSGYDLATGLGSADGYRFVTGWNTATASTTTLTASETVINPGDSVQLTASVKGSGTTATGTVTFLTNELNLGAATLSGGSASLSVSGDLIATGDGTVRALYSGDSNFGASGASLATTLNIPAGASYVVAVVSPNPVAEVNGVWPYVLQLIQKADVATTIGTFTIDGVDNLSALKKTSYASTFTVNLSLTGHLAGPKTRAFHFAGVDTGGKTWTFDLNVPFIGPEGPSLTPAITVTGTASTVQQNAAADASCQWVQQITVEETTGFFVSLTGLTVGSTKQNSSIPQYFGTTRLAPYGTLTANVCFSNITPPTQKSIVISGVSEIGTSVQATYTASFAAPAASTTTMALSAASVTLPGAGSESVSLNFGAGAPAWTASLSISGYANWLQVSPASGSGSATLNLQASAKDLSPGVYNAVLSVQAMNALPQSISVPVVFVVGGSGAVSIAGVNSAAAGAQAFAPGMWMAVYGKNLASSTVVGATVPFPLSLAGTSATVNGISAPLWFVSAGQMNVQIPYETGAGPAVLGVLNNGIAASYIFQVTPTAPGIFNTALTGKAGQTIVAYMSGDGDVTPTLATGAIPPAGTKLANFPQPRQAVSVTVGGEPADVKFAGIVTLVGATQINFTIPADLTPGPQPLVVTVGGVSSAPVSVTVTAP